MATIAHSTQTSNNAVLTPLFGLERVGVIDEMLSNAAPHPGQNFVFSSMTSFPHFGQYTFKQLLFIYRSKLFLNNSLSQRTRKFYYSWC